MMSVRFDYDDGTNEILAMYIDIYDEEKDDTKADMKTIEFRENWLLDINAAGNLVGVEILDLTDIKKNTSEIALEYSKPELNRLCGLLEAMAKN